MRRAVAICGIARRTTDPVAVTSPGPPRAKTRLRAGATAVAMIAALVVLATPARASGPPVPVATGEPVSIGADMTVVLPVGRPWRRHSTFLAERFLTAAGLWTDTSALASALRQTLVEATDDDFWMTLGAGWVPPYDERDLNSVLAWRISTFCQTDAWINTLVGRDSGAGDRRVLFWLPSELVRATHRCMADVSAGAVTSAPFLLVAFGTPLTDKAHPAVGRVAWWQEAAPIAAAGDAFLCRRFRFRYEHEAADFLREWPPSLGRGQVVRTDWWARACLHRPTGALVFLGYGDESRGGVPPRAELEAEAASFFDSLRHVEPAEPPP